MSTNSRIGIKRLDGTEKYIYCHWDGYIEHNGLLLQLCYDTPEKIEKLLVLGNISVLAEYLETDKEHSFNNPCPNVVIAYHRDRGEELAFWDNKQQFNYIIDALIEKKKTILDIWEDDEFATKENLFDVLLEKARKQVAIANERKAEEYDSWYRAYCD